VVAVRVLCVVVGRCWCEIYLVMESIDKIIVS
jgi:hypothetical protein